jgi:predicted outer membrane repeat protein
VFAIVAAVFNTTFERNRSSNFGAAMCIAGQLTADRAIFTSNDANGLQPRSLGIAGAVSLLPGASMNLTRCAFTDNKATVAGAVGAFQSTVSSITHSSFTGNFASNTAGAIANLGDMTVTDSSFTRCTCSLNGGALYSASGASIVSARNTYSFNAGKLGSAFFCEGNTVATLTDDTLQHNAAAVSGGAIATSGRMQLTRCTARNNTAQSTGGAAFVDAGAVFSAADCSFKANSAQEAGGALSCKGSSVALQSCAFSNNTSAVGGAISASRMEQQQLALTNCSLTDNVAAAGSGGAVYADASVALSLADCTVAGNTATIAAGGVFVNSLSAAAPVLERSSFSGNAASCCYAAGFGYAASNSRSASSGSSSSSSNCVDVDSGEDANCCAASEYSDGAVCSRCNEQHYDCSAVGLTAATLPLRPGYWRADASTIIPRKCWYARACSGGAPAAATAGSAAAASNYCAAGYTGPCE